MKTQAQIILKKYFGYDSFRPMQEEIIDTILKGEDSIVLMPTGGGKSICYQLPAMMMDGLCIVISPLISLMKNQVESLKVNGVPAEFLNSSLSFEEEKSIIYNCEKGNVKILYMSPERTISSMRGFLQCLQISFIAIDEAHCISQWGHDFRPEYTQLKIFRERLTVGIVALTATADKVTRKDIAQQLTLSNPKVFISSFDRANLSLSVYTGLREKDKIREIINFIKTKKNDSGIIYCLSRKGTEKVAKKLAEANINAAYYHAGMNSDQRSLVQEKFIHDEINIICATIAFGMGIDKSNVRWVIHYNLPKNLEGYYQEIGRAGRDGLPSDTILYYNLQDVILLSSFINDSAHVELNTEKLKRMRQYAEANICRRKILLNYFNENYTENCNNCDICKNPPKFIEGTILAQKALSAIVRLNQKVREKMLINVLRGSQNRELLEKGYYKIKTYGVGKDVSYDAWAGYILQFLQLGLLEIAYDEGYVLKVTSFGYDVLQGKSEVLLTNNETPPTWKKPKQQEKVAESNKNKYSEPLPDGDAKNLFDLLSILRKQVASEQKMPPYIIFHNKTLNEMALKMPQSKEQMLTISGVSENKFNKYGSEFLSLIQKYCTENSASIANNSFTPNSITVDSKNDTPADNTNDTPIEKKSFNSDISVDDFLTKEKITIYVKQLLEIQKYISPEILGKILLGSNMKALSDKLKNLPFYGVLKKKTTYPKIEPILQQHFDAIDNILQKNIDMDSFFSSPHYNHLDEKSQKNLQNIILQFPVKPDAEITNSHILEQRKKHARAYESWSEKEEHLLLETIKYTNDIQFLSQIFQRNDNSIKSALKKNNYKSCS